MDRSNHYEAAFAAFLRERSIGFVPVDEARRVWLGGVETKSVDFIVVGSPLAKLVVDVKGRRFPSGPAHAPRLVWERWATAEDVAGLLRWESRFGAGFRGILAFVYEVQRPYSLPPDTPDLFPYRDRQYLIRGVRASDYRNQMKCRSPRWGTVDLSVNDYRRLVRPFSAFVSPEFPDCPEEYQSDEAECPVLCEDGL